MSDTAIMKAQPVQQRAYSELVIFSGEKGEEVRAIVRQTEKGLIKSTRTAVPLRESRGELYPMKVWKDGQSTVKWPLTAQGYYRLNQFGGMVLMTPDRVIDDEGRDRPNPFLHRVNGEVEYVRVRKVGVGRNPTGQIVAIDYTLTYALRTYFLQDLMAKYLPKGKNPQPKDWGVLLPRSAGQPQTKGTWQGYDVPGDSRLWVNMAVVEVIQILQEHLNRQRFAERNAITICERNVLKRFYATTTAPHDGASVQVVGWTETDGNFRRIAERIGMGEQGQVEVDGEVVDLEKADERVSDPEEIEAAIAGDPEETGEESQGDDEPPAAGVDVPAETVPQADEKEIAELRASIRKKADGLGDVAVEVLMASGIHSMGEIAECADALKLAAIHRDLETAQLEKMKARGQQMAKDTDKPGEQGSLLPEAGKSPARHRK